MFLFLECSMALNPHLSRVDIEAVRLPADADSPFDLPRLPVKSPCHSKLQNPYAISAWN